MNVMPFTMLRNYRPLAGTFILMALAGMLALLPASALAASPDTGAHAAGRNNAGEEELAGSPESSDLAKEKPPVMIKGPAIKEPERSAAGQDKNRPELKLPEVVVKGERDLRITSERKDMFFMDPMRGTKGTPADLVKVAIPGLDDQKDMPSADTVTAKNYLFTLEGGVGAPCWTEGRMVAGLEMDGANVVLRSEYNATEHPESFGIVPYDLMGNASLDAGVTVVPGARFFLGLNGRAESNRQPANNFAWGHWLDRLAGGLQLGSELQLSAGSLLRLQVSGSDFLQQGDPADERPALRSLGVGFKADWEYSLQPFLRSDMDLLAGFAYQSADSRLEAFASTLEAHENLKTLSLTARFRPVSILMASIGVVVDDFRGVRELGSSAILADLSLALPTETTLYASLSGGLHWQTPADWAFQHPRQAVAWLPAPEEIKRHVKAGLQQKFGGETGFIDVAWFQREARESLVWLDPENDGLFIPANLPQSRLQGVEAEMELNYTRRFSQKFSYVYRMLEAGNGQVHPNIPLQEGKTELRVEFDSVSTGLSYRYLGARHADPDEGVPSLAPVHLLSAQMDIKLGKNVNVYAKLENILNIPWDEWKGYPGRGISYLGGLRLTF